MTVTGDSKGLSSGPSSFKEPYKAIDKDEMDFPDPWHRPFASHSRNDPQSANHGGVCSVHH